MRAKHKIVLSLGLLGIAVGAAFLLIRREPPAPVGTPEEHQIALACLEVLHSPLAGEAEPQPDDPRLPQVIRDLHPLSIMIDPQGVVVMIKPTNGLAEYHLQAYGEKRPGVWRLYGAGPKYDNQHRELHRVTMK